MIRCQGLRAEFRVYVSEKKKRDVGCLCTFRRSSEEKYDKATSVDILMPWSFVWLSTCFRGVFRISDVYVRQAPSVGFLV